MDQPGEEFFYPMYDTCDGVSARCPIEATTYGDYFTLGACAFFVGIYGALLIAQAYLGWRSRAWAFVAWLAAGTAFELMGYAARIYMSFNPWSFEGLVINSMMLVLGPTLTAAAISVTFKHLVLWYGPEWSLIKPGLYPWVFVGTDFISIVIQGAGGGISAIANGMEDGRSLYDAGSAMLVAGVSFQVANMVLCGALMLVYVWRRKRAMKQKTNAGGHGGSSKKWSLLAVLRGHETANRAEHMAKVFIAGLTTAYVAIIIRCIYRIPEMSMGWANELMQNETLFLILDGAMILLAAMLLTVVHPALLFPFMGKVGEEKEQIMAERAEQREMREVL
ncbi:hypothetical protein SODALDRAFT_269840 [Sodiomyces alkalinus F11]|uniref:RTA1-domain-containing protein n=1 Tax=Sodiomyces alkalinus (strain CBS 110278 / VKM F-3762 / F11) TaxID=1314773 RepID=A0A3N2Q8E2_SODAK|nr:hypothetical protein SODALDRAFT_269840 [Sodiomyces alkalinus F11]ROT42928.1 hypothetical protein SODALDRAFT_269840 [Sodiomyces alkalinus F11]